MQFTDWITEMVKKEHEKEEKAAEKKCSNSEKK